MKKIALAYVEDHQLLRAGLTELINQFENYIVTIQANNGKDFIEQLPAKGIPEIVLLDIQMPKINGYATAEWLQKNHPEVKIIVVSQFDHPCAVHRMLSFGACGFILKDEHPSIIKQALDSVYHYNFYIGGTLAAEVRDGMQAYKKGTKTDYQLTEKEVEYLQWCPTGLSNRQIAEKLNLSEKCTEHLKEKLGFKLTMRTRQELTLFAMSIGITPPLVIC